MSAPEAGPALGSLFRLDGKVALVVGGYGGIGAQTSELLAAYGAAVAVAGRSLEKAEACAAQLTGAGGTAIGESIDLADPADVTAGVARVVERLGGLDVIVNLASVDIEAPAEAFTPDDWRRLMAINLDGAFWLTQAAGRVMIAAGRGGSIVHFSSTRGFAGGRRGFSAYGSSKAGLNLMIKQVATEWGQHAIRVNGVAPGFVPTELTRHAADDQQFSAFMLRRIPMGRFGSPLEMASAVLFLATPASSFVTGQIIYVDGGVTASS